MVTFAWLTGQTYAKTPGCTPVAKNLIFAQIIWIDALLIWTHAIPNLETCTDDLGASEADFSQIFPGVGYENPDAFGISVKGRALSYADNGDGTYTENNTGLMWKKKMILLESITRT